MPDDPPPHDAPPVLRAGATIGPYTLVRFVAAGGAGQVWEAEERELGRTVALKLLLPGRTSERDLERFAREARAGARRRHPNLVATYAYGEQGGTAWIAQEFVPGAWTLEAFLDERRRSGRTPRGYYRQVAGLVAALADGLHAAHEAELVHRDVKPANVLLDAAGTPRLTDFGLARSIDDATLSHEGAAAGTWAYMSPEQVRARRGGVDRRSDVFSTGVVLYELLTLRRPFDGDSAQLTAERILREDPPDPRSLRSACPDDLATICLKAIEKPRERRYPTAADLAADLRRFLTDESIRARPPSAVERARRFARRHPAVSAGAAVGGVSLAVVSTLLAGTISDARKSAALAAEREEHAVAARSERDRVLRLAARVAVDDLREAQRALWPPTPSRILEYEAWIAEAQARVAELDGHRETLSEVRSRGDGDEARWWTARLEDLIAALESLRGELLRPGVATLDDGWSVPDRLAFARELERGLAPGGAHRAAWDAALPALREAYPDAALEPVPGLVPLGPDPESGLWEFAHLATGAPAARAADGKLSIEEATGVVLVLVPGGRDHVGEQSEDPTAPNHEPAPVLVVEPLPLTELDLPPFWIAKHELTQAQWQRLTGETPSAHRAGTGRFTGLHPVESITLEEATAVLGRVGLEVPTEDRWEFACRAGTDTRFSLGAGAEVLHRMNLGDRTAHATGAGWASPAADAEHDDGAVHHAPVGTWPANPFGLHEVHGNVAELCRPAAFTPRQNVCVSRGGHFAEAPVAARSTARVPCPTTARDRSNGVRPARSLGR